MNSLSRLGAAIVFCTYAHVTCAAEPNSIKLQITADPADKAISANLAGQTADPELAKPIPVDGVTVDLPLETVDLERSSIYVKWTDGALTSFPVYISSVFGGRTIALHFFRPQPNAASPGDIQSRCVGSRPTNVNAAFKMFFECREYALRITDADRWTKPHLDAIAGWLIANVFLYNRTSRKSPISPYGVDPDLVDRVNEIIEAVDAGRKKEAAFMPVRVADARALVKRLAEEEVKFGGFVPILLTQGRINEAIAVNAVALNRFQALARTRGTEVVEGLSSEILLQNQQFLETLANQPTRRDKIS